MGGSRGFASLANIVLAEAKAQIGFVSRMVLAEGAIRIANFVDFAMITLCLSLRAQERAHASRLYRTGELDQVLADQQDVFELRLLRSRTDAKQNRDSLRGESLLLKKPC